MGWTGIDPEAAIPARSVAAPRMTGGSLAYPAPIIRATIPAYLALSSITAFRSSGVVHSGQITRRFPYGQRRACLYERITER